MASRTTTDPIEILLEMGVDLDNLSEEEDYLSALMEAIATIEFKTKGKGDARSAALRQEVIKIRKGKRKPQAKKTRVSADSFKKGTATTSKVGQKALPSANIEPKTSIIPYQKPDEVDDEEEGGKKKKARTRKKKDKDQKLLEGIAKSVSNIADILKEQYGLKKKKASYDRKKAEADKRKLRESGLEKSFKGLASAAEKIIAPVKSVLDRIFDFLLKIIVGRFLVKLIGWFGDPKNKKKVDSVIRFLVDHGPKLLAAFLLFGTGIGRFAVRLSAVLLKGALRLGAAAAQFALGFARRHPAAAAITAIVGGAAIAGAMNKKDDAGSSGAASPAPGSSPEPTVSGRFDMEAGQGYINNKPVSLEEYTSFQNMSSDEKVQTYGTPSLKEGGFVPNFFGMAKGAGSSIKEKGFGNAVLDFAGGALGGVKNFMDEKGISDVLMAHPLAKLGLLGFDKGKELLGGLTDHLNETGLTDILMQHPLAKMGSFGLDKFMNFGKDPARDITGESGQDIKGAGVDTQLISARPGDFVVNKKTATAMGPDYFDNISSATGEKITGAGPDTQMIAVRPGEIVVNRETVDAVGADHFLGLNKLFGGSNANKPKMAEVQAASGGGFVLPTFSGGGEVVGSSDEPSTRPRGTQRTPDIMGTLNRLIPAIGEKFSWAQKLIDPAFYGRTFTEAGKITGLNRLPGVVSEAQKMVQPTINRAMRVGGEAQKILSSGIDYAGRMGGEAQRMVQPTIDRAARVGGEVQNVVNEKVSSTVEGAKSIADNIMNQDYDKFINKTKNMYGAAEEAVPALIGGLLGMDRVDRHISKDMQRAILDAKKTAEARGSKNIDYGDYEGGGLSAAGLTMGRVGDQEFKRDAQGRIIGLTQTFDTNRPAEEAMLQAQISATKFLGMDNTGATDKLRSMITTRMKSEGASPEEIKNATKNIKSGGEAGNVNDAVRAIYKPFEALLDVVQDGGTTTHDVMFDKDILGFDPVEAPPKPGSPNYQLFKDGGGMAAMSQGKTVGQVVDAGRSANSTNPIMDFLGLSKPKPTEEPKSSQEQESSIKKGPQPYFSSTTNKFYASYGEALKDPQVAAAAQVEKTKASLSFPKPSMTMPEPPPGGGNNVKVIRVPSSNSKNTNQQSPGPGGSEVDAAQTGNGNKAKWNILGIPLPF